jgi:hypothetical protein
MIKESVLMTQKKYRELKKYIRIFKELFEKELIEKTKYKDMWLKTKKENILLKEQIERHNKNNGTKNFESWHKGNPKYNKGVENHD